MATEPGAPLGPAPMAADTLATAKPASLWRDTLGSVLHQRSAVVGLTILTIPGARRAVRPDHRPVLAQRLAARASNPGSRSAPPRASTCSAAPRRQPQHLFGTRRQLPRRVQPGGLRRHGSRWRSGSPLSGSRSSSGTFIGAIAGYFGSSTDNVLMRLMDVVLAFPSLLLAIAIVVGPGRPELLQRAARDLDRLDPDLCPHRALVGDVGARERLRHRVPRAGRVIPRASSSAGSCPTPSRRSWSRARWASAPPSSEIAALAFVGVVGASADCGVGLDDRARAQPAVQRPAP